MAKAGPGLIEPDMELFCKAAADGNALGDCPFAHYIQVRSFALYITIAVVKYFELRTSRYTSLCGDLLFFIVYVL